MENAKETGKEKDIFVKHLDICESMIEKGMLRFLKAVRPDRLIEGQRIYYFDNTVEVKSVFDQCYDEWKKANPKQQGDN